jgi:nucleoside-diphosphate-sugar epimerase
MTVDSAPLALVTGAPGWLGTRLVHALKVGLAEVPGLEYPLGDRVVRCLVVPHAETEELRAIGNNVQIVHGDLQDPECLSFFCSGGRRATLFHVAGVVHPARSTKEFVAVNVIGTENLVRAAVKEGVRRVVHVSSNSPCGTSHNRDQVLDESAPYNPFLGYGKSKMRAEEIVKEIGSSGAIETVIVRPPWFYGPGQPIRQTQFFRLIRSGCAPIVGNGENRRSMAYLDNICQGLLLCERVAKANGGVFWIADERPYTLNEIVDTVERVMEQDFGARCVHRRLRLPSCVSEIAALADALVQATGNYSQNIHVLSEMNKTITCSIEKAKRELGYFPRVALEEGMRRSIRSILERGELLGEHSHYG